MKRVILIVAMLAIAAMPATSAPAKPSLILLLAGGAEESQISIALSPDGRTYVINSIAPLEVGGEVCWHPEERPTELLCEATAIGGFEVNAGAGDDSVRVFHYVQVPVTLRGGPGNDQLIGGGGPDKLVGGSGNDVLKGLLGNDALFGGPGADRLFGGSGDDSLRGGPGFDALLSGGGTNTLLQ